MRLQHNLVFGSINVETTGGTGVTYMTIRHRIENSSILAWLLAAVAGSYLALCNRTTTWEVRGEDNLRLALADGPILLLMWHERSLMGAVHWPVDARQLSSLYASSPIGRVSGALQRRLGLMPMEMSNKQSNLGASRVILRRVREGGCIGMTGDGPLGPIGVVKNAPLEWARSTNMPIFAYAFSTKRHKRLDSWDHMMLPLPFTSGGKVFVRLDLALERKSDSGRKEIGALMTRAVKEADRLSKII